MDESGESLEDVAHACTSLVGSLVYTYVVEVGQGRSNLQKPEEKRPPPRRRPRAVQPMTGHGIGKTLQENAISNGQVFEIEGTTKPHSGGAAHDPVRINLTRRRLTLSIGSGRNWNSEIKVWSFKAMSSAVWEEGERVRPEREKGRRRRVL
ncbi:hypothetical protein C1H46_033827 [Malus baccata]|uniref:Uncharacterized protein n=1 Tax=Malus baccata TaxID=106549 RepID=A0A540L2G0_MALBA|nr:hypothetical protein C1H46_033827 [Malus baccata]